jgi:DNA (cytosine-5)-methyltransferase 1
MRLLDLFCGAGGAAVGYSRAGFEVVGVDIKPQKHFPFEFHQADAMTYPLDGFDFIHASPPCQDHMRVGQHPKHGTGWMLAKTRERLQQSGTPWVIENVPGAPMRADFVLCGCQFNLPHLRRERWFEASWPINLHLLPSHDHRAKSLSVVGHGTPSWSRKNWGRCPTIAEWRAVMGIEWMTRDELSQAIPPAYTEWIGRRIIECAK